MPIVTLTIPAASYSMHRGASRGCSQRLVVCYRKLEERGNRRNLCFDDAPTFVDVTLQTMPTTRSTGSPSWWKAKGSGWAF